MNIMEKNLLSILCGVVVIIAIVALMWPAGQLEDLQKEVTARGAVDSTLSGLTSKERLKPTLENNAEPEKLEQSPSEALIAKGKEVTKRVEEESHKMLKAA